MKTNPASFARILVSGLTITLGSLSPSLVAPAAAEDPSGSCCKTAMGNDGCEDTDANICRSKGECHSTQAKECVVGWLGCSWMDNPNCHKEME